jgi:hypothetical protein
MVRHLPSTIKQLLALRNLDAYAGPSFHRLSCLLEKTYADACLKRAGTGWLVLAVCTTKHTSAPFSFS